MTKEKHLELTTHATIITSIIPEEEKMFTLTIFLLYGTRNFTNRYQVKERSKTCNHESEVMSVFKKTPPRLLKLMNEFSTIAECKINTNIIGPLYNSNKFAAEETMKTNQLVSTKVFLLLISSLE